MSEGLNVADLYTTVKFNPDQASLGDALKGVKEKFEDISKKVNGIASGVKGMFALQAFSAVAGIANRIAGNIGAAAANAQQLSKMAARTGKSVEELQKRQGLSVILSKQEVDALANISRMFSDMSNMMNKQVARLATIIEPIITGVRDFLNSKEFQGIIEEFKTDLLEVWKIASPIMNSVMSIFKQAFSFVKQIWKALQPVFASVASIVKMAINLFNTVIKNALPSIMKLVKTIIKPILTLFIMVEEFLAIFDDSVEGWYESKPEFKGAVDKIKAVVEYLRKFFGYIWDVVEWVITKTAEGWTMIFERLPDLWNWLVKVEKKIQAIFEAIFDKFEIFSKIGSLIVGDIDFSPKTEKEKQAKAQYDSDADWIDKMINKPETPVNTNNRNSTTNNTSNITVNINGGASSPAQVKKAAEEGVLNANRLSNTLR